jgi:ubiquitin C-terminal hydrolase
MNEDLYKNKKKPFVPQTESEGKSDEAASAEAWNKHVYRNESIIIDLFYGQFKSTVTCCFCKRISITFDPFLTISLPIPSATWTNIEAYHI